MEEDRYIPCKMIEETCVKFSFYFPLKELLKRCFIQERVNVLVGKLCISIHQSFARLYG